MPAGAGPGGCSPSSGASPTRASSGCSRTCRASTAPRAPCWPTSRRTRPGASSSQRKASPTTSSATSPSRWWPASGPAATSTRPSYPARHLFRFLDHHGMLTVTGSPTWRTVAGGSATYVDRLVERLPDVRSDSPVTAVTRHDDGVDVLVRDGAHDDLRPRRRRHPRRPGPRPARRRDTRREGRPRRDQLLPQRDLAAPRLLGPAEAAPGARPRGTTGCTRATRRPPTSPSATG